MATAPSPGDVSLPPPPPVRGGRAADVLLVGFAVATLALIGLVVAGRVVRAPGAGLTWALLALPHLWAVLLVASFGLWSAFPDRRSPPAMMTLITALGALLWGPSVASWGAQTPERPVRVLAWNIQRLWGGPGEAEAPSCVIAQIEAADPDLVALTEVSRRNLAQLESLGMQCVHTTYTSTGGDTRGGLAVCGRNGWRVGGGGVRYVDDEDWRYLSAEAGDGDRVVNVLAVHLLPHWAKASARPVTGRQADHSVALLERVRRLRDPTVVAGDFNTTRDFYLHAALRERLTDVWEAAGVGFGATRHVWDWLPIRIDFLYVTRDIGAGDARVLGARCSDHLPLLATVDIPTAPGAPAR